MLNCLFLQASTLCTYIAKGNVALSILFTLVTTIGAIFMTPLLCKILLGTVVPVDAYGIAVSTMQVLAARPCYGFTCHSFTCQKLGHSVLGFL